MRLCVASSQTPSYPIWSDGLSGDTANAFFFLFRVSLLPPPKIFLLRPHYSLEVIFDDTQGLFADSWADLSYQQSFFFTVCKFFLTTSSQDHFNTKIFVVLAMSLRIYSQQISMSIYTGSLELLLAGSRKTFSTNFQQVPAKCFSESPQSCIRSIRYVFLGVTHKQSRVFRKENATYFSAAKGACLQFSHIRFLEYSSRSKFPGCLHLASEHSLARGQLRGHASKVSGEYR